nr:MAG TPA: hypothetical protein [Caudoviricetes sp.]
MFGYMMHTSDDVLEDLLTHKIAEGRVPEADPTRAHLEMAIDPTTVLKDNDVNMDQLYDDLIKGIKETRPVDTDNDDIDWDVLCRYLINET